MEYNGARHTCRFQGQAYAVTEDGALGTHGTLYRASDGAIIDTDIYLAGIANMGFVNICSTYSNLYWCKATGVGIANQVIQSGAAMAALDSEILFGAAGGTWDEGMIGHIRTKPASEETLYIVRKDEPEAAQPNKSVVYRYTPSAGPIDKTGNLPNNWRGTGNQAPPNAWDYHFDNVGITFVGINQY